MDSIEVQQMKAQAKEEKARKKVSGPHKNVCHGKTDKKIMKVFRFI